MVMIPASRRDRLESRVPGPRSKLLEFYMSSQATHLNTPSRPEKVMWYKNAIVRKHFNPSSAIFGYRYEL
jgi:hypothetical protein